MSVVLDVVGGAVVPAPLPYATREQARTDGTLAPLIDATVDAVLEEASRIVDGFVGAPFLPSRQVTVRLGRAGQRIVFPEPVQEVRAVTGVTAASVTVLPGTPGSVLWLPAYPGIPGVLTCTVKSGWPVIPGPVWRATVLIAAALHAGTAEHRDPALRSLTVEGYARTWDPGAAGAEGTGVAAADGLLRPYRRSMVQIG